MFYLAERAISGNWDGLLVYERRPSCSGSAASLYSKNGFLAVLGGCRGTSKVPCLVGGIHLLIFQKPISQISLIVYIAELQGIKV